MSNKWLQAVLKEFIVQNYVTWPGQAEETAQGIALYLCETAIPDALKKFTEEPRRHMDDHEVMRKRKDLAALHRVEMISLITQLPEELLLPLHQFWDTLPKGYTPRQLAEKYFETKGGADNVTVAELRAHLESRGHDLPVSEIVRLLVTQEGGE